MTSFYSEFTPKMKRNKADINFFNSLTENNNIEVTIKRNACNIECPDDVSDSVIEFFEQNGMAWQQY